MSFTDSAGSKSINQREHNIDASGKRTVIRAQDIDTGDWVNVGAKDNGDGTFSIKTSSGLAKVDDNNSTTTTLGSGGVFTGDITEVTDYAMVWVSLFSDVDSATDGLEVQWSSDGVNFDNFDRYTIKASTGKIVSFGAATKYVRVVYTNGTSAQGEFRLQTILKPNDNKPSSHRLDDDPIEQDDVALVKSVISGKSLTTAQYNSLTVVQNSNDTGTYYSLPVVGGGRPSDIPGRITVRESINDVTVDTQIHTNTTDKVFYLTDIIVFCTNEANVPAVAYIRDGTTASGDIKIPLRVESTQGVATRQTTFTHTFQEPVVFNTGVFFDVVDDMTASITITGYEE